MGLVDRYPLGTFCWVELATPDIVRAARFYEQLLGWTVEPTDDAAIAKVGGHPVAGLTGEWDAGSAGWRSFVAVEDPAAVAGRATDLGGAVVGDGMIRDPQGAELGLRGPADGARLVNEVGAWSWNELVTPDLDAAAAFYSALFGWQASASPGPIQRQTFTQDERLIGASHAPTPGEGPQPRWEVSFRVGDVDAAAASVQELGGRLLLPPMDVPGGRRFTIAVDQVGAAFTLITFDAPTLGVDGSAA